MAPNEKGPEMDVEAGSQRTQSQTSTIANMESAQPESPTARKYEETQLPLSKLDWDSPEDTENPMNWPMWKKVFNTTMPALYGFAITFPVSSYTPAIPIIMQTYHVDREIAILPLAMYTAGFVFGPLVAAPLSELYGRRIVYWVSMTLLIIFIAISGSANSVTLLIVMRFLAGLGGSTPLAVGGGTISDLWDADARGKAAIGFIISPFMGPVLGPLIGAYIISEYNGDWRYSQWVVLMLAGPIFLISLFMSETSKHRILYLRQKKLTGKAPRQAGDGLLLLNKLSTACIRPLHMVFVEPLVGVLSVYTGFSFAMTYSFFGSYNYVFQSIYHFNQKEIGLTFIGILVGFLFAVATFAIFDATLFARASKLAHGNPAPEHRLYAAMVGSILMPAGLFWFAWALSPSTHWIVPVLAGLPFGWGSLAIFLSASTYLVDVYQAANSSSALAANGMLRYGFGAAFPLFTVQMYQAMGVHWAGSVFAFVGLAMVPIPWVFFWKGKELRARSRYDTNMS